MTTIMTMKRLFKPLLAQSTIMLVLLIALPSRSAMLGSTATEEWVDAQGIKHTRMTSQFMSGEAGRIILEGAPPRTPRVIALRNSSGFVVGGFYEIAPYTFITARHVLQSLSNQNLRDSFASFQKQAQDPTLQSLQFGKNFSLFEFTYPGTILPIDAVVLMLKPSNPMVWSANVASLNLQFAEQRAFRYYSFQYGSLGPNASIQPSQGPTVAYVKELQRFFLPLADSTNLSTPGSSGATVYMASPSQVSGSILQPQVQWFVGGIIEAICPEAQLTSHLTSKGMVSVLPIDVLKNATIHNIQSLDELKNRSAAYPAGCYPVSRNDGGGS